MNLDETISQIQNCGKLYITNDPTSLVNKWKEGKEGRKKEGKREREGEREKTGTD